MVTLLFMLLCFLSLADCITTYVGLKSKYLKELNPLMAWLMNKIGVVPALATMKIIALSLVSLFCMYFVFLVIANAAYLFVVGRNAKILYTVWKMKNE